MYCKYPSPKNFLNYAIHLKWSSKIILLQALSNHGRFYMHLFSLIKYHTFYSFIRWTINLALQTANEFFKSSSPFDATDLVQVY